MRQCGLLVSASSHRCESSDLARWRPEAGVGLGDTPLP